MYHHVIVECTNLRIKLYCTCNAFGLSNSVPYESEKVICDGYIANSSLVYIATHNVTKLEDQASEIFRKLNNFTDNDCLQLMKAFVCNSLFLSFHYIMDSTPVHICQQSCDAIFECGDEMFKLIQNQLSVSTNFSSCISPTETEDRNSSKCIDLLPPSNESSKYSNFRFFYWLCFDAEKNCLVFKTTGLTKCYIYVILMYAMSCTYATYFNTASVFVPFHGP